MTFWKPEPSIDDPNHFHFRPPPEGFVSKLDRVFLMGGVGFGAMLEALEMASGRSPLWATTQFVGSAVPGAELEIGVEPSVVGGSVIQARAELRQGNRLVQQAFAALGGREGIEEARFAPMPDVPCPEQCPEMEDRLVRPGTLVAQFDKRIALSGQETGREAHWIRHVDGAPLETGMIAIIADFMGGMHRRTLGCTSLDNTLRFLAPRPSEWVLCDTQFSGFANGAFHGTMHLYAQDGELLANASQTALMPRPE